MRRQEEDLSCQLSFYLLKRGEKGPRPLKTPKTRWTHPSTQGCSPHVQIRDWTFQKTNTNAVVLINPR